MKQLRLILIFILNSLFISAQNLILNPSFEEFSGCPFASSQIWKSPPWKGYSIEYNNACAPQWGFSVPYNPFGFQYANSGIATVGFIPFTDSINVDARELIFQMIPSLIPSRRYCASFFTNLADASRFGIDCMEIYVCVDSVGQTISNIVNPNFIPASPGFPSQVRYKGGIISDTSNWIKIEGSFVAEGGEKYFYMGCLSKQINEVNTQWFTYNNIWPAPGFDPHFSYYFIDDVSLYELNKLPQAQNHAYNCAANTVTLKADTGFNFRWYYLPDTVNVLSTADTFVVDASTAKNVLLRATLCSTEFTDTVAVPKLNCTGIENNALAQGAALFPNPANSMATFTLQGTPPPGTTLHLTDLNGRELRSYAVLGKTTEMHLQGLSAGVYVLSYRYKENVIWKGKLAVMK